MKLSGAIFVFIFFYVKAEINIKTQKTNMKTESSENRYGIIRCKHGRKADDYRNQETT
jgi:hypothetical protein